MCRTHFPSFGRQLSASHVHFYKVQILFCCVNIDLDLLKQTLLCKLFAKGIKTHLHLDEA